MRLSVRNDDPGYNLLLAKKARPYLQGQFVDCAITADEELGIIIRHNLDRDGKIQLTKDKTEILLQTLHGSVEIRFDGEN